MSMLECDQSPSGHKDWRAAAQCCKMLAMIEESIGKKVARELAPGSLLRVAINLGNPVLAQRGAGDGDPRGVSVDLARELARRLDVSLRFVQFDAAGKVFAALPSGVWDLAFLAIDPVRARDIEFTPPYVIIEGTYLVPDASPLRDIAEADRAGMRIAVAMGSAYDLHLSRTIRHAAIIRLPSGPAAFDHFRREALEALAGVKSPLVQLAASHPGLRVIPGRFMAIEQALGTPKGRGVHAARYLRAFVEEMKVSGFVEAALNRSGQHDATVAPAA